MPGVLGQQEDPQQLQLRADKIRHLEFHWDDAMHHQLFKHIRFPILEHISLDTSDQNDEKSLESYLQPALKNFRFYGGPISDTFLEKLQTSCPQLEELLIDYPHDLISPEGFLRFLDGAHSLKQIILMYGIDRVVNDDVFFALATRPNLQILKFQKVVNAELMSIAKSRQNQNHSERQLFPRLRKLVCTGEIDGLISLLPHLTQLTHLETTILGSQVHISLLPEIATYCPNLQFLQLEYSTAQDISLSPDELVKLSQALPHLEHLQISGDHISAPGLENVHISKISEALPSLKVLELEFECALTEAALVEVGKGCGGALTKCQLWGSYNLLTLEESDISFPLLQELILGKLVSSASPENAAKQAENIDRLLKRVAPNLGYFSHD
ncbi:hypothetical protein V8E54_001041 [Elaphomyces granulatus]